MSSAGVSVALALLLGSAAAVENSFFINRTSNCLASTQEPRKPRPLEFCYWHNANSCCTPGNDALAMEKFFILMDIGPGCSPSEHNVRSTYFEVRDYMCMGCHPEEPTFRYSERQGDAHLPGGTHGPNVNASEDSFVHRICASFLYGTGDETRGLWGGDGGKFDDCGINMPAPCSDFRQVGYDGVAKSFVESDTAVGPLDIDCGGDVLFPRNEYGAEAPNQRAAARAFLAALPQWIPDFKFVVVNDSATDFNYSATPCFRGSFDSPARAVLQLGGMAVAWVALVAFAW